MLKRRSLTIFLLAGLALVVVWSVVHVLQMRFEQGDNYPAYSSFRSDPVGTRALLDSVERLPGVTARRWVEPVDKLRGAPGTSLLILGATWEHLEWLDDGDATALIRFVEDGGRLVYCFAGTASEPFIRSALRNGKGMTNSPVFRRSANRGKRGDERHSDEVGERWGVSLSYGRLEFDDARKIKPVTATRAPGTDPTLPEELAWHSSLRFSLATNGWSVLYTTGTNDAVAVERRVGAGSVVLVADSYFVSNEALFRERQPALLRWMLGGTTLAVFEETHLGTTEEPGVASLIRKYNLTGVCVAMLAVFGLFIWRNASPLVPSTDEDPLAVMTAGRDSHSGLVNLLRRAVPPATLADFCWNEWKRSAAARAKAGQKRVEDAEKALAAARRDARTVRPIAMYHAVARVLHRKRS